MTEEQARITQCCGPEGSGHFNEQPRPARWCVASDCMAWRRQTVMIDRGTGEPHIPGTNSVGKLEERYSDRGFCGLAGQPS